MQTRFRVLRTIATIFKIVAWIVLVVGLILSFASLALGFGAPMLEFGRVPGMGAMPGGGFGPFIAGLVLTVIYFLTLYAWGEGIHLFLAIEENTRETALLLKERERPSS